MADASTWGSRVALWRASGMTSTEFCEGKEFTAGGLRHWAHRLGKTRKREAAKPRVHLARVLRRPAPQPQSARSTPPRADARLVVELGGARVSVLVGFDQGTLAAVLDVLAARRGEP